MQPRNPMLDTYRSLTAEMIASVSAALPKPDPWHDPDPQPGSVDAVIRTAQSQWAHIPARLDQIDTELTALGEAIFTIATNPNLTDPAKATRIDVATAAARVTIDTQTRQVRTANDAILSRLHKIAYPQRPQPADAAQEAAIANLKADLRMVWDTASQDRIVTVMGASLSRAIADDDTVATWLLASSRYPEDYLVSRGYDDLAHTMWAAEVADTLNHAAPANLVQARRVYRTVSDVQRGLPLLDVLFTQLDRILDDLHAWRPSQFNGNTPFTRTSEPSDTTRQRQRELLGSASASAAGSVSAIASVSY